MIINAVRKHKGIHSLADCTLCDGRTIDPWVMTDAPSDSSRVFPVEKPTRSDFNLFRTVVRNLSSHSLLLPFTLGPFIGQPHRPDNWFLSPDESTLFHAIDNNRHTSYSLLLSRPHTHFGKRFGNPMPRYGAVPRKVRASVIPVADSSDVILHSSSPVYIPSSVRQSFLQRLHFLPNQSLWRHFKCDGDGSWIYEGLLLNSLVMVSDGSYNPATPDCCSCGAVIWCKETGNR